MQDPRGRKGLELTAGVEDRSASPTLHNPGPAKRENPHPLLPPPLCGVWAG